MNEIILVYWNAVKVTLRCSKGQGMVEYALILTLVSAVAISALILLGKKLGPSFINTANGIP